MAKQLAGPSTTDLPVSEWERTDAGLRAVNKLFDLLFDEKPAKGTHEAFQLELQREEVRRWAEAIGERRHEINVREHQRYMANRESNGHLHFKT